MTMTVLKEVGHRCGNMGQSWLADRGEGALVEVTTFLEQTSVLSSEKEDRKLGKGVGEALR